MARQINILLIHILMYIDIAHMDIKHRPIAHVRITLYLLLILLEGGCCGHPCNTVHAQTSIPNLV